MPLDDRDPKKRDREVHQRQLPALKPSTALTFMHHVPSRPALTFEVPKLNLPTDWRGRTKFAQSIATIQGAQSVAQALTELNKKQVALEESYQDVDKVHLQRPYQLEAHVRQLHAGLESLEESIALSREQQRHAALEEHRKRELDALQYKINRHHLERELAEAREQAATAHTKAARHERAAVAEAEREALSRQAEAEEARRKYEAVRARGNGGGDADEEGGDVLAEIREAKARRAKISTIRKRAEQERAAILAEVDGDERQLSDRQREELEAIEQWAADAEERVHTRAAAGLIFPSGEDDE